MRTCKVVRTTTRRAAKTVRVTAGVVLLAWTFFIFPAGAGTVQLLSARDPSFGQPGGANGPSVAPVMTPEGRFVLFASTAGNLVTNANNQLWLNLYLRDRQSNTTTLVSANYRGTGGGNGSSASGSISRNGRYVAFQSAASDLLPGDTNTIPNDIFVRDLWAGTNILVSVATNGGWTYNPIGFSAPDVALTPDGRYILFVSGAPGLVAGDTNSVYYPDVFVRDLVAGQTTLVSVGATQYISSSSVTNVMPTPVITPDGRYVAFVSASGGVGASAPHGQGEVYVRDLVLGTTTWASVDGSALAPPALGFIHPRLSDDGRYVAFKSVPSSAGGPALVLLYDTVAGLTTVVSTNGAPAWTGSEDVYGPEMTPDGRFIAYASDDLYLNAVVYSSIHLWDAWTEADTLLSVAQDGSFPTNTISKAPVFSPDGYFVAFLSNATNLVPNTVSNGFHVYSRDLLGGVTLLVDADTNGVGSTDEDGTVPSVSYIGQFVAFCSPDGSLVNGDTNGFLDVFVRNVPHAMTELISQADPAAISISGSGISSVPPGSVTPDGRWVVFVSKAEDLVTNDFNGRQDVFVRDLLTGSNTLVSVGADGNGARGGDSSSPAISADGRYVAFLSRATNIVAGATNYYANVFRRDLLTGVTTLVSAAPDRVSAGTSDSTAPVISQDGRYVAFLSYARNLVTNVPPLSSNIFWRDIQAGITASLLPGTNSPATLYSPTMSADGRYVAFMALLNTRWQLFVWDSQLSNFAFTNAVVNLPPMPLCVYPAALSPAGGHVLYTSLAVSGGYALYVADLGRQTNILTFLSQTPARLGNPGAGVWSTDGRFFTASLTTLSTPNDTNGTGDVYLGDVQTGTVQLISVNSNRLRSANGLSDSPVISGDGHYVIFRSFATDIVPGITTTPNLIVFDRLSNTLATVAAPGWDWTSWVLNPAISGNGNTIAFQSWQSVLVPSDGNRLPDVFAATQQPGVAEDSDADGIPDWWTMQYFGRRTGWFMDQSRAQDDPDRDGMNNLQEFLAGTDPKNAGSVLGVQISTAMADNGAVLSWVAAPGRNYQVQFKNGLNDPAWQTLPGAPSVVGYFGSFAVPADQPSGYYRVVVSLP